MCRRHHEGQTHSWHARCERGNFWDLKGITEFNFIIASVLNGNWRPTIARNSFYSQGRHGGALQFKIKSRQGWELWNRVQWLTWEGKQPQTRRQSDFLTQLAEVLKISLCSLLTHTFTITGYRFFFNKTTLNISLFLNTICVNSTVLLCVWCLQACVQTCTDFTES